MGMMQLALHSEFQKHIAIPVPPEQEGRITAAYQLLCLGNAGHVCNCILHCREAKGNANCQPQL